MRKKVEKEIREKVEKEIREKLEKEAEIKESKDENKELKKKIKNSTTKLLIIFEDNNKKLIMENLKKHKIKTKTDKNWKNNLENVLFWVQRLYQEFQAARSENEK